MLIKTHLAITLFFVLLFVPFVKMPLLFLIVALLATYIPDFDSKNSKLGNHWYFRPFQWFVKHRGFVHSFSFLFLITFGLVLFLPFLALGFFLGYSSHLIADSFTIDGIKPFYPFKKCTRGGIAVGGINELNVFVVFVLVDAMMFIARFFYLF